MPTATLSPTEEARVQQYIAAREQLLPFCQVTFQGYQWAPHLQMVADALEEVERGELKRLVIELPPRHGKSELVSIRFPAFALCKKPTRKIISASYGDELAHEMGRRARNVIDTQPLFPSVQLSPDSKSKNLWHTTAGGQFLAVGIGSGVIGFGGDIITIDDPFKKREEAESEVQRQRVWNWYTSEVLTRQEPGAAIVLVMHRWHQDDLVGRVLDDGGDRWRVIHLPAIAEADDALGRDEGEALWPWRYDQAALAERRSEVGERDWNSLYQQRPSPAEGAIFKWFPTYPVAPQRFDEIVIPIDTAYTRQKKSDYTAWSVWARAGHLSYLIDAGRTKGEAPDAERAIKKVYERMRAAFPSTRVKILNRSTIAIDRVAGQHLRRGGQILQDGNYTWEPGLRVVEVKLPPGNSKEEHGMLVSIEFEAQRALVPTYAPWLQPWIEEHKQFPFGANDDWVETTLLAMQHFYGRSAPIKRRAPRRFWGKGA